MSTKEYERRHRSSTLSVFLRIKRYRSRSSRQNSREKERGMFKRLRNKGKIVFARSDSHNRHSYSRYREALSESEDSGSGHGNQDQRRRSQVGRRTTYLSHEGKWQPRVTSRRNHFHHGNSNRVTRSKISKKEDSETSRGRKGSKIDSQIPFPSLNEEEGTEGSMITGAEIGGHCIHRMANTTTGKDWRRRAFRFGLNEFRGGKVTIFIQRNYWKTKSQKTTSSSVNSSQNAETPGRRRSNYSKKQQVIPAGMCIGIRTRKDPLDHLTNIRRKSQCGNKPRIYRTNNNIGSTLTEGGRNKLCGLLQHNLDIFAWKPADMTGILRHIANVKPT
nr:reverse transcriptase domain-containing protein [Tanacetum cinerariifolium]